MTDNFQDSESSFTCDVLVIGGGVGGLLSAISAKNHVEEVILVDKGFVGKTSQSALANAGNVVAPPGTDIDAWVDDLVENGDYISHQDLFYEVLKHSYENIMRLEKWGVEYQKDNKTGELVLNQSRGTRLVRKTKHQGKKHSFPALTGGEAVINAYRKQALIRNVKILNRIYIDTLLTNGDRKVVGAVGFETRSGQVFTFLAKAVVVATGGASFRGDYANTWFVTGDGFRLAYGAGAELENMEFNLFNTGSPFFWWEGTGPAPVLGARFLNAKKEQFVYKYHPLGDRADIGFITRAMALESRIGNGPPFYLTFNEIPDQENEGYGAGNWSSKYAVSWMPVVIDRMKEFYNFDAFKEPSEWMPVYQENGGGVRADINCATNVKGLFVSGQAMSTSPDLHTGWSFARYTWNGYKAGDSAGMFARTAEKPSIAVTVLKSTQREMLEPLAKKGVLTADEAYAELRNALFGYEVLLLKHEHRLKMALDEIERITEEVLPKAVVPNAHELVKLKECESMLLVAEMTLKASIMRTESRSSHFREDYPYIDNDNWLKWIVIQKNQNNGEMSLRTEPLPIGTKYRIVPPPGKHAIPMPQDVWVALRKNEPCPVDPSTTRGGSDPSSSQSLIAYRGRD